LERVVEQTLSSRHQAEPFRQLALRIQSDLTQLSRRTVVLVGVGSASPTAETVIHAAAALAELEGNALLIDGDLAGRRLTEQLGYQTERGLTAAALLTLDPLPLVQATSIRGLSFLPSGGGKIGDAASGLLHLETALNQLVEHYPLIIVDGGKSGDIWAPLMGRLCEATYFLVRLGATEAMEAQSALSAFRAAPARLLGCIALS
jgi:Mrp family chromosome partitioning ATPase